MKRAFKMKEKAFFIIFKGLSLKQIKRNFLEDENVTIRLASIKDKAFFVERVVFYKIFFERWAEVY